MIHSLVCVILPISLPPAYKPSFFDNPNFTVEEDKDATEENPNFTVEEDKDGDKEVLLPDDETKWWIAWETVSHLILYFLDNDRENRDICEISLQRYYIMLSSKC